MSLKIIHTFADYPEIVNDYVDFNNLDAFQSKEVLNVIHGDNWESIVILDNKNAFIHSFSRNRINNSDYFDIEPFLGYAGPIVITENNEFIKLAIESYSAFCRKEKIIAEIFRFNPILKNYIYFEKSSIIISPVKEIVVANCKSDRDLQLNEFSKSRKRDIKTALRSLNVEICHSPFNYKEFYELYIDNLNRNNARKEWYFPESFFSKISKNKFFYFFKVYDQNNHLHSVSIFILHSFCSYYFLAANNPPNLSGANDLLIFEMCKFASEKGSDNLILGGGNTSQGDDPLLLYKKKFNSQNNFLYLGKLVHNNKVFESFCNNIITQRPELSASNFFLKYRSL
jgi:hypothetical protein